MKDYFLQIMHQEKNGLYLCEIPTGIGKSYNAAKAIHDYAKVMPKGKKVFYLTAQNKNVDAVTEDLKGFYKDEETFKSEVLHIRANVDELITNIENVDISKIKPDVLKEKLKTLSIEISEYKKEGSPQMKKFRKEKLMDAESKFRKLIRENLDQLGASSSERLEMIRTNPDYQWIGTLYPAVFTEDKKVILMSVSKFMNWNSVIYKNSYRFIHSNIVKNSVIFLDEFNLAKDEMYKKIYEDTLRVGEDYLDLFRRIVMRRDVSNFNTSVLDAKKEIDPEGEVYNTICQDAKDIYDTYRLAYNYKMTDTGEDIKEPFLFSDREMSFVAKATEKNATLSVEYNKEENRMDISYKNEELRIEEMLQRIHECIFHFASYCHEWAHAYREMENERRAKEDNIFEEGSALSTILDCFGLSHEDREIMMQIGASSKQQRYQKKEDTTYYDFGFEYYQLVDKDDHNQKTKIRFYGLYETPESILLSLCRKASVVALSATAEIESVLTNFNLEYLENNLMDDYHPTPDSLKAKIKAIMDEREEAYKSIHLHAEVIGENVAFSLPEETIRVINSKIENMINCISGSKEDNGYYRERYCSIVKVMEKFAKANIKSILCLEKPLAKDDPKWDKGLLKELFTEVCKATDTKADIRFLSSNDFDRDKDKVLKELSAGKKIMILSSYTSIGAGQNMQYPISDTSGYVKLPVCHKKEKDIDAVYLGQITNIIKKNDDNTNINRLQQISQIEELYENDEIVGREEKKQYIQDIFKKGKYSDYKPEGTDSAKESRTEVVMQAIGRICRCGYKNPEIYIFVNENVLGKMRMQAIRERKDTLPPETVALLELKQTMGEADACASSRSGIFHDYLNRHFLSPEWNLSRMREWENMRLFALQYPTCNEDELSQGQMKYQVPSFTYIKHPCHYRYSTKEYLKEGRLKAEVKVGCGSFIMDEESARLPEILNYPGMMDHFKKNGFAVRFEQKENSLNPVAFTNIYKGALGEIAGEFIFLKELGKELDPIDEPEYFEKFDFAISGKPGYYVDFKNWNELMRKDRDKELEKACEKMEKIHAKKVLVINIVADGEYKVAEKNGIVEIPGLIRPDGSVIKESIDKIKEVLSECAEQN